MLIEIRCDKFREGAIPFHSGLNVVLGDEKATNSIGKSTLLMIIDYAFGGNTFIDHNFDAIDELGAHEYFFTFKFDGDRYVFKRGTFRQDLVYKCTSEFEEMEPISIEDYRAFLRTAYDVEIEDISFRAFVSLYSRIWGKDNINVKKPLHTVQSQKPSQCVDNLLKIYNKYSSIKDLSNSLKSVSDERSALNAAFRKKIIPKINKTKYNDNAKNISDIKSEIQDIKDNLSKYATNISEITNREILELKVQKDDLLRAKLIIDGKLLRVRNNLSHNRYIKSKHLRSLTTYFPDVNLSKLAEIEEFHSDLSKILKKELIANQSELSAQLELVTSEIGKIDTKISETLSSLDNPAVIVDRVYELSNSLGTSKLENEYYETGDEISELLKVTKSSLSQEKKRVIKLVEDVINDKIRTLVTDIYNQHRKSPVLSLSESNYSYEIFEDTGTGKAYSNLLMLDLAVFSTTKLPFLIHDSLLFKNIENDAVANLIDLYLGSSKQSFIAIDEIVKYGRTAEKRLNENKVIQLNDNSVLYIKDWRK